MTDSSIKINWDLCAYGHTTRNPLYKDVVDRQMYNCVWYFCIYLFGLSLNGWRELFCMTNNRHGVTITTHASKRHFLIWMTTVRQPTKRRCSWVLTLKYTFICVYWWLRQKNPQHLDCSRSIPATNGDTKIPDSAQPRLESCYPPFVAGIDLPHQGVVDSYNLQQFSIQLLNVYIYLCVSVNRFYFPWNIFWKKCYSIK